ncbi:MAG: nuclear transport factor 2 family protein [Rickettsiales bacterium]
MTNSTAAQQLLTQFINGYNARDMQTTLGLFKEDFSGWGSAKDEYWLGKSAMETQLARDWSQAEFGEIIVNFFAPNSNDNWAAADCSVKLVVSGQALYVEHLRGSIVADNTEGEWKIAHFHTSFPDARNEDGSSFPSISSTCFE